MNKNGRSFESAISLRKEGKSYSEISKLLGIPKGTLSYWLKNVHWSKAITQRLVNRYKSLNADRLIQMNKAKHIQKLQRYDVFRREAQREYEQFKQNRLFMTGIALYWGEGDKTPNGRIAVINSDPNLLEIVVSFYRLIIGVHPTKIRGALFLYKDLQEQRMKRYWSDKLHIPISQFIKTQILPSRSHLTKHKMPYGICSVYASDTKARIKIAEWIRLTANTLRV